MIILFCHSKARSFQLHVINRKNFLQHYFPGPAAALPVCNVGKLLQHLQLQGNIFSVANLKSDIKICYYVGTEMNNSGFRGKVRKRCRR